jgi:hypothetical protein
MAEKTHLANQREYCDNTRLGHSGETTMTFGYGLIALIVAIAGYLIYAYNALVRLPKAGAALTSSCAAVLISFRT